MSFKTINTGNEQLTRVQANVKAAFDEVAAAAAKKAQPVTTTGPMYRVTGDEAAVFIDARRGPVTVVLPASAAAPIVLRSIADATNAVTVSAPGATIDGASMTTLPKLGALLVAFDGRNWWSL